MYKLTIEPNGELIRVKRTRRSNGSITLLYSSFYNVIRLETLHRFQSIWVNLYPSTYIITTPSHLVISHCAHFKADPIL